MTDTTPVSREPQEGLGSEPREPIADCVRREIAALPYLATNSVERAARIAYCAIADLEAQLADVRKECDARGQILDAIQAATGSTWWNGALDWIKRAQTLDEKVVALSQMRLLFHAYEQGVYAGNFGFDHRKHCPYETFEYRFWWCQGCVVGESERWCGLKINAFRQELIDIGKFAAGHHGDEESCLWLHALTVDIPTMVEQATGEQITKPSTWEFPPDLPKCQQCGAPTVNYQGGALFVFECGGAEDAGCGPTALCGKDSGQ